MCPSEGEAQGQARANVSTPNLRIEGLRVGALVKADDREVHFLGYGRYDGRHTPPFGPFGLSLEDYLEITPAGAPSWLDHRITLDDGRIVWGSQCWWDAEARIRELIGRRIVVMVSVPA